MATKASRSGRRLIVFALLTAALYGGVALSGDWTPKLGLDLQGGTRITLEASTATGEAITPEKVRRRAGSSTSARTAKASPRPRWPCRATATSSSRSPARTARTWSTPSSRWCCLASASWPPSARVVPAPQPSASPNAEG